jgi:hypothetical protein
LLPYKWLWQKKISIKQYLVNMNPLAVFQTQAAQGIGVDGVLNRTGYAPDGSYVYTKFINGSERNIDDKFELIFRKIHNQGPRYEHADKIHERHFGNLLRLIKYMESQGAKVVVFIPPLAPSVITEMTKLKNQYAYIQDLQQQLMKSGISFYDFHDPQKLMTHDCEFVDGAHGGDLVYAKILDYILKQDKSLAPFLQQDEIKTALAHYKNIAMIPRSDFHAGDEVDFLHLGCDKSQQLKFAKDNHG